MRWTLMLVVPLIMILVAPTPGSAQEVPVTVTLQTGNNAVTARIRTSLILYRLGRPEDALKQLDEHLQTDPGASLDLAAARGELLTRMGRYEEALKLYDRKLLRYPGDESLL